MIQVKLLEIKTIIYDMRSTLGEIDGRLTLQKKKISKLEDIASI